MGLRTLALLGLGGVGIVGLSLSGLPYSTDADAQQVRPRGSLASFRSDAELLSFLKERTRKQEQDSVAYEAAPPPPPPPPPPMAAPPAVAQSEAKASDIAVTGSRVRANSDKITNTQEANVDEGGIVKKRGDILVILRRGRLFTVSVAGGGIRPIDHINAFPPGVSGQGDWYDEMLISGDRVVVIGYSYARGGTEVNRFRLSPDGKLRFEDAYHLRSNDYYSSRNYASRLIGNRLIYYTPLYLDYDDNPFDSFPAISRWDRGSKSTFKRIAGGRDTYVVPSMRDDTDTELDTLHTVMDCDLTAPTLDCKATAVLGPESRTFYVSPSAVYLWVSDDYGDDANDAWLYRIPLNRSERLSAIQAMGAPTDQFSFREDGASGLIDVLVRREGGGDAMWRSENNVTDVALLSVPISTMGDGSRAVRHDRYRFLPGAGADEWNFQNRFVGNHVLYGGHAYRGGQQSTLIAVGLRGGPISQLPLPHAVERLDQMGSDGIVIGSSPQGALTFTSVILDRPRATIGSAYAFPNAQQGEQRSQAFYFRQDNDSGTNGLLGLPITRSVENQYARFLGNAAAILYLNRSNRQLSEAGRLDADYYRAVDDKCQASCVDWYGNARPIFIGNRVFALMGYELVEGRQDRRGRIGEVQRANFAPTSVAR